MRSMAFFRQRLGENTWFGRILVIILEFCMQWMFKKCFFGNKLLIINEEENWDCSLDYSSKMGVYFDLKYLGD